MGSWRAEGARDVHRAQRLEENRGEDLRLYDEGEAPYWSLLQLRIECQCLEGPWKRPVIQTVVKASFHLGLSANFFLLLRKK